MRVDSGGKRAGEVEGRKEHWDRTLARAVESRAAVARGR